MTTHWRAFGLLTIATATLLPMASAAAAAPMPAGGMVRISMITGMELRNFAGCSS